MCVFPSPFTFGHMYLCLGLICCDWILLSAKDLHLGVEPGKLSPICLSYLGNHETLSHSMFPGPLALIIFPPHPSWLSLSLRCRSCIIHVLTGRWALHGHSFFAIWAGVDFCSSLCLKRRFFDEGQGLCLSVNIKINVKNMVRNCIGLGNGSNRFSWMV